MTTTATTPLDTVLARITTRTGWAMTRSDDRPVELTIGHHDPIVVETMPGRLGWENVVADWYHAAHRMGVDLAVESFDIGDLAQVMTGTVELPLCDGCAGLGVRVRFGDSCHLCGTTQEPESTEAGF